MRELLEDTSSKAHVKQTLLNTFRRRIDSLDIQRYRLIQRLGIIWLEVFNILNFVAEWRNA